MYLQSVDDTKKYLLAIQRVFADNAKSIAGDTKKYLQTIQNVFADDTGNLPEETTIRDREFAYTTACLVEGQFFGLWNVPLFVFLVYYFATLAKMFIF